jgi:glycosyltransferase involved in cell wall biosynthesis
VNVLFLTHAFPRHDGDAAGSFILRLAVALRGEGIHATVLAPAAPGLATHDSLDGVAVRRFRYAPRRWETLAYEGTMVEQVRARWSARGALLGLLGAEVGAVRSAAREVGAALLHAHWWFPNGVAGALASSASLPMVITSHGSDVRLARSIAPARRALRWVASRASAYTAVSRWLADGVHEMAPSVAPIVAPMPVPVELFAPPAARVRDHLLFVGRLNVQKGLDRLLRALARVRQDVTLDVVGDGEDREALARLADELGVAARVRWHGAQPHHRLPHFYAGSSALVMPSMEEGLGLVAAEAALCELPVVAFDSGGVRDLVLHERTGLLATNLSAEALAASIDALLSRADQGASLGAAGRTHALATVSPSAVARRYASVYRDAIARRA